MRALTIVPIFFLLGSTLLLILTAINGAGTSSVLGKFYWSETDTSGIQGAPQDTTRWTFYRTCGVSNGRNSDCTKSSAAYPYSPKDNFGSESGLPESFISNRNTYYYLSRIGWSFIIVGLFFAVIALIIVPLNFCFAIGGTIASVATGVAFLFTITAACLITAAHVKGRNAFNNAGHHTSLSAKSFGILWAAVATLLITLITSALATWGTKRATRRDLALVETVVPVPVPVPVVLMTMILKITTTRRGVVTMHKATMSMVPIPEVLLLVKVSQFPMPQNSDSLESREPSLKRFKQ